MFKEIIPETGTPVEAAPVEHLTVNDLTCSDFVVAGLESKDWLVTERYIALVAILVIFHSLATIYKNQNHQ